MTIKFGKTEVSFITDPKAWSNDMLHGLWYLPLGRKMYGLGFVVVYWGGK